MCLGLLVAVLPVVAPSEVQTSYAECPVHIALAAQTFHSSVEFTARLVSDTLDEIHLPYWLPRGLRFEPATGTSVEASAPDPTTSNTKADSIYPLRSRPFQLKRDLLPIQWEDVGIPTKDVSEFTVRAGTYRARLVFAVVAPREQRGPMVHLCTVYSSAFVLETDIGWTKFR
jgi:hypothetical protein